MQRICDDSSAGREVSLSSMVSERIRVKCGRSTLPVIVGEHCAFNALACALLCQYQLAVASYKAAGW